MNIFTAWQSLLARFTRGRDQEIADRAEDAVLLEEKWEETREANARLDRLEVELDVARRRRRRT